ncbi:hypothetical protein CRE_06534 [Caenorhabditis remanei]|uniref:Uncharacterized protein n=1 Tax=Caenorhabditis remanei TaxID=31234 RepID=E3M1F7_CAERE|nr:hypothetical protein CRE_06534 [Caenorhabditis remanei]
MAEQQGVEVNKKIWHRPVIQTRRVIEPQTPQLDTRVKNEILDPEVSQVVSVGGTRNATPIVATEDVVALTDAPSASVSLQGHQVPITKSQTGFALKPTSGIGLNAPIVATPTVAAVATVPTPLVMSSNYQPSAPQPASQLAPTEFFQAIRAPNWNPQLAPSRDSMYAFTPAPRLTYPPFPMVPPSNSRRPGPPPTNTTPSMNCQIVSTPRAPRTTQPPNLNMSNSGPGISQPLAPLIPPQQIPNFDPSRMPHHFHPTLINSTNSASFPNAYLQQQFQQLQLLQQLQHTSIPHFQNTAAHGNRTGVQTAPTNQSTAQLSMPDLTNNGKQELAIMFEKHMKEGLESATKIVNQRQSEIEKKDEEILKLKMELQTEQEKLRKCIESNVQYHGDNEALEKRMKLQEDELDKAKRSNVEKYEKIKELSDEVRSLQAVNRTQKEEYEEKITEFEMSAEDNGRKLAEKDKKIENLEKSLQTSEEEIKSEIAKNQDLTEKLNKETTSRNSDWLNWNAAREDEKKKMEERHQKETKKLKEDQKDQVADLQREIDGRDTKIRESNEKNEKERKEWKEAKGKEIKEMEEAHQKEKKKLISDHSSQIADFRRKIQEREDKMKEKNEQNERERAEQDRKHLLGQKTLKEDFEKRIQEKEREIEAGKNREKLLEPFRLAFSENFLKSQQYFADQKKTYDELVKPRIGNVDEKSESLGGKECNMMPKSIEKDQPNKDEELVSETQIAEEEGQRGATGPQKRHCSSSKQGRETKMKKME